MLSAREQEYLLREAVETGRQLEAERFSGMLRGCVVALAERADGDRRLALLEYLTGRYENGHELFQQVMKAQRPAEAHYPSYADLDLPPIEWFWNGWAANGLLTVFAAPPGSGKSLIAQDLARRLIDGLPAPDGQAFEARSRKVIYVDAEDMARLTVDRGRMWNMDLRQMYPMLPPSYGLLDLESIEDRDRLIEMAHAIDPGLIIVDSFSRVTSRGDSNVEEVRPVLSFLTALAGDTQAAVILIHHARKRLAHSLPGLEMTMDDARGSGDIGAAARVMWGLSVVQVGPELDLNGPRKLQVLKSNLGKVPAAIGCELVQMEPDGVRVAYGEAPEAWREPTESDHCAGWIVAYLEAEGGPVKPKVIIEDAEGAGYSRSTVYKARRMLAGRIENTEGAKSPGNEWVLVVSE